MSPVGGASSPPADLGTAVVIVNFRTKELSRAAVSSVLTEPEADEIIVVDNASGDGSTEYLRAAFEDPRVRILQSDTNPGFGPAVNRATAQCHAPFLFILNSDATLVAGSLGRLIRTLLAHSTAGVVAPAVYEGDGITPQPAAYLGDCPGALTSSTPVAGPGRHEGGQLRN